MKNYYLIKFVLILVFAFLIEAANAQTVYATNEGKKYHKKNCSLVNEGKKGMKLEEAKTKGLEPCQVCKPDEKKSEATEPKKTKKK